MTLLITVLLGVGGLFIISAIENQSLQGVLSTIFSGGTLSTNPIANPHFGGTETKVTPPDTGTVTPPENKSGHNWFDYATTQAHGVNGETGIDLATPFHTNVSAPLGGTITDVRYGGFGGLVTIRSHLNGRTVFENFVHLDTIAVAVGQVIGDWASIGLSGGQLTGGFHPARPPFSTGAHIEYGLYNDVNTTSPLDPTSFIKYLRQKFGGS